MEQTAAVPEPPYQHAVVVDAGYPRRVTRAVFARSLRSKRFLVIYSALVALSLLIFVGMLGEGDGSGSALAFAVPAAIAGALLFSYLRTRRTFTQVFVPGSVLRAGLTSGAFHTSGPTGSSALAYWTLGDVEVRGEFLFVQSRTTRKWSALPAALVPGAAVDELRTRIAAASRPAAGAPATA